MRMGYQCKTIATIIIIIIIMARIQEFDTTPQSRKKPADSCFMDNFTITTMIKI